MKKNKNLMIITTLDKAVMEASEVTILWVM